MDFQSLYDALISLISPLYGARESKSIAGIYFEDRFNIKDDFSRTVTVDQSQQFEMDKLLFQKGQPVQYIVGKAFFFDHFFEVNHSTLIPRPETEELVAFALDRIASGNYNVGPDVLDIGTGSGCILLSIMGRNKFVKGTAIDISPAALELAHRNAEKIDVRARFLEMDFLEKENWSRLGEFDLVVSNPPYIMKDEFELMQSSVFEFEPESALFPPGNDPLIFYKKAILFMNQQLRSRGEGIFEISSTRRQMLENWIKDNAKNYQYRFYKDLQGNHRILHLIKKS